GSGAWTVHLEPVGHAPGWRDSRAFEGGGGVGVRTLASGNTERGLKRWRYRGQTPEYGTPRIPAGQITPEPTPLLRRRHLPASRALRVASLHYVQHTQHRRLQRWLRRRNVRSVPERSGLGRGILAGDFPIL